MNVILQLTIHITILFPSFSIQNPISAIGKNDQITSLTCCSISTIKEIPKILKNEVALPHNMESCSLNDYLF